MDVHDPCADRRQELFRLLDTGRWGKALTLYRAWTRATLKDLGRELGVGPSAVARWEANDRVPQRPLQILIRQFFQWTPFRPYPPARRGRPPKAPAKKMANASHPD